MPANVPLELTSRAGEGLLGLVSQAEQLVLDTTTDPVGILHIELSEVASPPTHAAPIVAVDAAFVERAGSGVVERLEVHVGMELDAAPDVGLCERLAREGGGSEYTSLCLSRGGREVLDFTLHYGSWPKLLGTCTALVSPGLDADDVAGAEEALRALGVSSRRSSDGLGVSRRRFSGPPEPRTQVAALTAARARGFDVELFTSTLPLTRSLRLSLTGPNDRVELVTSLCRQIPKDATSIARDAVALKDLLAEAFGFDIEGRHWRIDNAHGEASEHRTHAPLAGRRLEWSLNWGARRR